MPNPIGKETIIEIPITFQAGATVYVDPEVIHKFAADQGDEIESDDDFKEACIEWVYSSVKTNVRYSSLDLKSGHIVLTSEANHKVLYESFEEPFTEIMGEKQA
jgi:hypothetical protein